MEYLNVIEYYQSNIENFLGVETKKDEVEDIYTKGSNLLKLDMKNLGVLMEGRIFPCEMKKFNECVCGWRGQWIDKHLTRSETFDSKDNAKEFLGEKIKEEHQNIQSKIESKVNNGSSIEEALAYDIELQFCKMWGDINLKEEWLFKNQR